MEDKKKLENDQVEQVVGGSAEYEYGVPRCFKCGSENIHAYSNVRMKCLDCGFMWEYTKSKRKRKK
jgi:hypothetical protein